MRILALILLAVIGCSGSAPSSQQIAENSNTTVAKLLSHVESFRNDEALNRVFQRSIEKSSKKAFMSSQGPDAAKSLKQFMDVLPTIINEVILPKNFDHQEGDAFVYKFTVGVNGPEVPLTVSVQPASGDLVKLDLRAKGKSIASFESSSDYFVASIEDMYERHRGVLEIRYDRGDKVVFRVKGYFSLKVNAISLNLSESTITTNLNSGEQVGDIGILGWNDEGPMHVFSSMKVHGNLFEDGSMKCHDTVLDKEILDCEATIDRWTSSFIQRVMSQAAVK